MRGRGVAGQARVIVKGAHTPNCPPDAIEAQLTVSLTGSGSTTRRSTSCTAIPGGAGRRVRRRARRSAQSRADWGHWRVKLVGGTLRRSRRLCASERRGPSLLNNNLSLAVMERPVWAGCITSNAPEALAFLRAGGDAPVVVLAGAGLLHGGGGAYGPARRHRTRHVLCISSQRRTAAAGEALAVDYGVHPHNIATAWVLGQAFLRWR